MKHHPCPHPASAPARIAASVAAIVLLMATGQAQPQLRVREIRFEGNETLASDRLLEQMYMYPTGWLAETIFGEDPFIFSEEVLAEDLDDLRRFYRREGFLDAELTATGIDADREGGTVVVTIGVREGPPVLVDSLAARIASGGTAREDSLLRASLPGLQLVPGDRFRDEALRADRTRLIGIFADNGYPFVEAGDSLGVDPDARTVSIGWTVAPGDRAQFGELRIRGNERFDDALLRERVPVEPGGLFRESLLRESEQDLYALTLFRTVSATPLYDSARGNRVPVTVTVQEAPPFRAHLSVGYGREERFRFGINLTYRGIFRTSARLEIDLKRSEIEPIHISGRYVKPDFLLRRLTFVAYPYIRREDEPSYNADRRGLRLGLEHPLIGSLDGVFSYTVERVDLDTTSISAVSRPLAVNESYTKSAFTIGLLYNSSQPPFDPDRGRHITFYQTLSGRGFGSPYQFSRSLLDIRGYEALSPSTTLAWRIKAGVLLTGEQAEFIPVEERFYSGGSSSVRGWRRFELGPRDAAGVPIGGNSLLEGSLEPRYPIWGILSGVVFVDFGNVWSSSLTYKLDELRYAAGAGLRVSTPVGPIRFDYARQLGGGGAGDQFFFSFGHAF